MRSLLSSSTMSSTCVSCPIFLNPNHDWKTAKSSKICGFTKFRRLQSSSNVFWIGVPDSSNRFSVSSFLSSLTSRQSLFLTRWPSSITRYLNLKCESAARSRIQISYDVTMTGKSSSFWCALRMAVFRRSARCCLLPWYSNAEMPGVHLRNSFIQLGSVASGAAMQIGPLTFFSRTWATSAITWIVFPRPISSANIPDSPFSNNVASHLRPST
mmetsp:Transcript_5649/g.15846  ORF Transcript_5649/g.15846 Transcript_5649/m.15846 type:complete len:213 (-) Transcript_5649:589-1227(-)